MNKEIIDKVRAHFIKFNFTFTSPYLLDEKNNLYAFAFIDGYASNQGAIIELIEPPKYEVDINIIEWCKKHDRWISQISIEPFLDKYNSSYFQEILDDWKI